MATAEHADAIRREVRIEAAPETVFDFFTDPELMVRWKGTRASLDPRPGGEYRVAINPRDEISGTYVEIDRPHRVVFTWGWQSPDTLVPPGSSTVEVDLVSDGDSTIVRLVHRDLPAEAVEPHTQGWDHYLNRLAAVATGRDPGEDEYGTIPEAQ